jgi:CBS domain containing-hemolysin-like protein
VCDLLQEGRINPDTLEKEPLTFPEAGTVLDLVEQLRNARVPMAIINDSGGKLTGVVTSTDLLETILGKGREPT